MAALSETVSPEEESIGPSSSLEFLFIRKIKFFLRLTQHITEKCPQSGFGYMGPLLAPWLYMENGFNADEDWEGVGVNIGELDGFALPLLSFRLKDRAGHKALVLGISASRGGELPDTDAFFAAVDELKNDEAKLKRVLEGNQSLQ